MKTIGIITEKAVQGFETAFSDTNEAIFHIKSQLEKKGHRVIISTNPSDHTLDIALVQSDPGIINGLQTAPKQIYLWPQNLCQKSYSISSLSHLTEVLWLSDWQRRQWSSLNPTLSRFMTLFGHGVDLSEFGPVRARENPHSCVYASQDARGLEILLRHWAYLKMSYPKATLDIYYGEGHWETVTDEEMKTIRSKLATLKSLGVKEHGTASRQEVHRALETCSMWVFPSTSPSAACMTALKAQLAGALPVAIVTQNSGDAEVLRIGAFANIANYYDILSRIFSHIPEVSLATRQQMSDFVRKKFTWEHLANQLENIINK